MSAQAERETALAALRARFGSGALRLASSQPQTPAGALGACPVPLRAGVHDVRPADYRDGPAALAFLLGLASKIGEARPFVWVRTGRFARADFGDPHPDGLAAWGLDPGAVMLVDARRPEEALWVMEEAAKSGARVLGELGEAKAYDLSASRRLNLAAEETGARLFVLGSHRGGGASAAWTRWRVSAAPGGAVPWRGAQGLSGLGAPRFRAVLERARGARPAEYECEWSDAALRFDQPSLLEDRAAAGPDARRAASG